jgi:hypothetical protein
VATLDRLAPPQVATPAASAWMPRRAIATALFLAVAIALLQVAQSSGFAHTGQKLQRMDQQKADLTAEIHSLEADVAALSSLDRTERAARDRLGMVPALSTDYISVTVPAPENVLLPRPIISTEPPDESDPDAWWRPLVDAIPFR